MDECDNEPNITLLDLTNDENDVDDETMSGMRVIYEFYIRDTRIIINNIKL